MEEATIYIYRHSQGIIMILTREIHPLCAMLNIISYMRAIAKAIILVTYQHVFDETTYPFTNFNNIAIEVWEWIRNLISCLTGIGFVIHAEIKVKPYE